MILAVARRWLQMRWAGVLSALTYAVPPCPSSCEITTREYCEFMHGYFHEEATLCSQVRRPGGALGIRSWAGQLLEWVSGSAPHIRASDPGGS